MGRGLISGAIWGAVISGAALSLASLLGDQPAGNAPPAMPQVEPPAATAASPTPAAPPVRPVARDRADAAPRLPEVPMVSRPEEATVEAPPAATDPSDRPRTGAVAEGLESPRPGAQPEATAAEDSPVRPRPHAAAPLPPETEERPAIPTGPARPGPPGAAGETGISAPVTGTVPSQPAGEAAAPQPAAPQGPAAPTSETEARADVTRAPQPAVAPEIGAPAGDTAAMADPRPETPRSRTAAASDPGPPVPPRIAAPEMDREVSPAASGTGSETSREAPLVNAAPQVVLPPAATEGAAALPAIGAAGSADASPVAPTPQVAPARTDRDGLPDALSTRAGGSEERPQVADAPQVTSPAPDAMIAPGAPTASPAEAEDRRPGPPAPPITVPTADDPPEAAAAAPSDDDGTPDTSGAASLETAPSVTLTETDGQGDGRDATAIDPLAEDGAATSPLPQGDSSILIRRPGAVGASERAEPARDEPSAADDAPALDRFAAPHDAAEGRPLMSIVLVDDGAIDSAVSALAALDFPVSVALDPAAEGAADLARSYRAAGFEVLALAGLPQGARPSDAEVILEAAFMALPEAVALVDAGNGGLTAGDLTEQVMEALAAEGRGFVILSRGLDTGLRLADRQGVPASGIHRDIDGAGQDAEEIRRLLDQAAFRARQGSGVVLLGRVRAETISALTLWGDATLGRQVALVPVSAVLRGDRS